MKNLVFAIFTIAVLVSAMAMANAKNVNNREKKMENKNKKVLVVYYSLSNNTKSVAEEIKKQAGGDIFRLETVQTYPSEYNAQTEQAKKEIADGYKPKLKSKINNIGDYDVIFVGSPCWWGTYAPAVSTFLADYNLDGKTVVPFMTHEGSGLGNSVSDMKKAAPKAKVADGLAIRGSRAASSQDNIKKFVDGLKL